MRHKWKQDQRSTKTPKFTCEYCGMIRREMIKPTRMEYTDKAKVMHPTAGPCPGKA